jgi:hypothetical protein
MSAMYDFCTYFDHRYLSRGLALYSSLIRHCKGTVRLWILCMNDPAYEALQKLALPGIYPIRLSDFERGDAALAAAKTNRNLIEYYFTSTPSLPLFILRENPSVQVITYLDSDLFFFSDPAVLFEEFGQNSVGIIGHRFPPALKASEVFGLYNVGFLTFRRDDVGLACLNWWRDRCNEWCYDHLDNGRFADQKYLDSWSTLFPRVVELKHKGANLAPWNLANYRITRKDGKVMVDEQELIFFHFHGFKPITRVVYTFNFEDYQIHATAPIVRNIYSPYALARAQAFSLAESVLGHHANEWGVRPAVGGNRIWDIFMAAPALTSRLNILARGLLRRDLVAVFRGRLI